MIERIYLLINRILPRGYKESMAKLIDYAAIEIKPLEFIGFVNLLAIFLSFGIFIFLAIFRVEFLYALLAIPACFLGVQAFIYVWLNHAADARARFVENTLPDALLLMAANIRAGMTSEEALMTAARPEFGPLGEGISAAAKEMVAGKTFEEAIGEIPKKIRSESLKETLDLIVESLRSGGELATILEGIAEDIRSLEVMKKEIRAHVRMYTLFILIATCGGAPLLYSISIYLLDIVSRIWGIQPTGYGIAHLMRFKPPAITTELLTNFSLINIAITSIFGALMLSSIEKGKVRHGYKYIPLLLFASFAVFLLARRLVEALLGGLVLV
jgi:archaellum biogenesis protein FlaJ (TadC family)